MNKKNMVMLLAGIGLFLIAAWQLFTIYRDYKDAENAYLSIQEEAVQIPKTEKTDTTADVETDTEEELPWYEAVVIDFKLLSEMNPDIIAWIHFDQNELDYPVLHTDNNDTYLHHMADGTANKSGSIFVESACSGDFDESYTIIYGHNMKDLSMFGKLKNYKSEDSYYEAHKYFTIFTPEKSYRYEIFSYYDTDETDPEIYRVGFGPDEIFGDLVKKMQNRSYRSIDAAVSQEDKVVTLSTCSEEGKRFVVHAVCVDTYSEEGNME